MAYFLEQLTNGLSLGCIYAFIALGYTMVYGIIKLINFAHGEFFMVGAFAGFFVLTSGGVETMGLPHPFGMIAAFLTSLVVGGLVSAILAVVVERVAYRPLQGASRISALLTALGVSLLLQNLGIQLFTAEQKGWPDPRRYVPVAQAADHEGEVFAGSAWVQFEVEKSTGGLNEVHEVIAPSGTPFSASSLEAVSKRTWHGEPIQGFYVDVPVSAGARKALIVVALAVSFAGLWLVVQKTRLGRAMRAVSWDPEAARLMGIRSARVISATFFIGALLAGFGGVIWGLRYGKVEPFMGFMPGLKAFIAAVVGGIGSLPGAVVGGILLGVLEVMIPAYLPGEFAGYKDAVAFVALILILLVKPSGLMGRDVVEKV